MNTLAKKIGAAAMALPMITGAANANAVLPVHEAYTPEYLADRQRVIDVITSVLFYADQRRWDVVEAAFANPVIIDYTSSSTAAAGRQEPQPLPPADVVAAWQTQLPGYENTVHMVTNPIVHIEGDKARVTSSVQATHFLPNDKGESYWVFFGTYNHELTRTEDGWRITLMRANKQFELGNPDLPLMAGERVKNGQIATTP